MSHIAEAYLLHFGATTLGLSGAPQSLNPPGFSGEARAVPLGIAAPISGRAARLSVRAGTPPAGASIVFTVYKNGEPTDLTCTIRARQTSTSSANGDVFFDVDDVVDVRAQNGSRISSDAKDVIASIVVAWV